jgi:SprT protein
MSEGQLDFFTRLLGRLVPQRRAPQPPPAPPPAPVIRKAATGEDQELIDRCRDLLISLGCFDLAARVRVAWSGRMRSTAGMAYPGRAVIKLNPRLREFGEEEIDRTLRHELAHLLAQHRAGRRKIEPHGKEWRRACADLGMPNEARCHTLPLPRRTLERKHLYRCPACKVEMRRVKPIRRATACLKCCRKHAGGRYDERFRFQKIRNPAQA